MQHSLGSIVREYHIAAASTYSRADSILGGAKSKDWEYRYLCESLVQEIWHDWCMFCRDILHASCRGAIALDGTVYPARAGINTWQGLGAVARDGKIFTPPKNLALMRNEPTWGDINKIITIINALSPTNAALLSAAFGAGSLITSVQQLQLLRNCLAHKNVETISQLKSNYIYYTITDPIEPFELIWKPYQSSPIAIYAWLADMHQIAELCA